MKKAGFSYILLPFLFLIFLRSSSFAESITIGNQSAETRVTNINNNGAVTTHIKTTANGQTNTVDSNESGEIDVKNENGKVTIRKSPSLTIAETENSTSTPKIIPKPERKNFIANFFENIRNFFKRIFYNL